MRLPVGAAASVKEAIQRTASVLRDALDHQPAPFEAVVAAIGGPRDVSRNPVFQVAFAMPRRELGELTLGGTTAHRMGRPALAHEGRACHHGRERQETPS